MMKKRRKMTFLRISLRKSPFHKMLNPEKPIKDYEKDLDEKREMLLNKVAEFR